MPRDERRVGAGERRRSRRGGRRRAERLALWWRRGVKVGLLYSLFRAWHWIRRP